MSGFWTADSMHAVTLKKTVFDIKYCFGFFLFCFLLCCSDGVEDNLLPLGEPV